MIKLIQSSQFDPEIGVGMEIVDSGKTVKSAEEKKEETIFGKSYDELKPDKNHVGIHVVALGDSDVYMANRNGDGFTRKACIEYHPTFVKNGHVFRHHRNKDPKKSIGDIVASAFNDMMDRIELFIHADKDKAAPELDRLERDGEISFSMACMVKNDRCSICGAKREHAGDDKECEHVRDHLGEIMEDGRHVFTFNDEPQFFDISFVGKPADRIAWDLMKVMPDEDSDDESDEKDDDKEEKDASATLPFDSVKIAEYYGVEAPDSLAIVSDKALRKYAYAKQLIDMHDKYVGFLTKSASADSSRDRFLVQLCKIASHPLKDSTIEKLRSMDPGAAFRLLGDAGVVMDSRSFFKYAMGEDFKTVEPYLSGVSSKVAEVLKEAKELSCLQKLCNDMNFDAWPLGCAFPIHSQKINEIKDELKEAAAIDSLDDAVISATISGARPKFNVDTDKIKVLNSAISKKLAEKYAAYKLAAIDAVVTSRCGENSNNKEQTSKITECMTALAALQDMQEGN